MRSLVSVTDDDGEDEEGNGTGALAKVGQRKKERRDEHRKPAVAQSPQQPRIVKRGIVGGKLVGGGEMRLGFGVESQLSLCRIEVGKTIARGKTPGPAGDLILPSFERADEQQAVDDFLEDWRDNRCSQ